MNRQGFTLVEMTVALVILAIGILGIASSASRLGQVSTTAQVEAMALQSVQDRVSMVLLHPNYAKLDSLYSKTEDNIPATGFQRVTKVTRTITTGSGGQKTDMSSITVTVSGARLANPISRTQTVGAP
jgi:prepilin-type N-terminal cleavage/methylation domain-containing protein